MVTVLLKILSILLIREYCNWWIIRLIQQLKNSESQNEPPINAVLTLLNLYPYYVYRNFSQDQSSSIHTGCSRQGEQSRYLGYLKRQGKKAYYQKCLEKIQLPNADRYSRWTCGFDGNDIDFLIQSEHCLYSCELLSLIP